MGSARGQSPAAAQPDAIALARTLVEKSGVGGEGAMAGLVPPVPDYLHQLGVTAPDQIRVLAHDVVMPTLSDHAADLTEIQVKSYAALLSVADMKAAIAFYDSPAGQDFVKYRYRRVQADIPQGEALIERLRPEIEARAQAVAHAHGWPPPG